MPEQLSQSQLSLLTHCPRKFQYLYFDQLAVPPSADEQAALTRGSLVHHLMQQRELGLGGRQSDGAARVDRRPSGQEEPQARGADPETEALLHIVDVLAQAIPAPAATTQFRQSEYRLTLPFEEVLLTVVYDLLVLTPDRAHILDWKTYRRIPDRRQLEGAWQTLLYPFVLAEATDYEPAAIVLSYWSVQPGDDGPTQNETPHNAATQNAGLQPHCVEFVYGDRQHQQTRDRLRQLIHQWQRWHHDYAQGQSLPQTDQVQRCSYCPFAQRCDRLADHTSSGWAGLDNIQQMDEIAL